MLEEQSAALALLRCPRTMLPLQPAGSNTLVTVTDDPTLHRSYRTVAGLPVLIDFEHSIADEDATIASLAASPVARRTYSGIAARLRRIVQAPNRTTERNVALFVRALKSESKRPLVLIIGGGVVGDGMQPLYDDLDLRVLAFDIYRSKLVQFVADAHAIPLADATVDGVIIQAVLELVLEPDAVVAEIHRVLRPGGLVYAETPFLQDVHEGPYDFTRFTESGHRFLFRRFERLVSGALDGAGTQLLWSLDYLARGLFRARSAGRATRVAFFWLRFLDRLVPERFNVDAASGVYFMGRRGDRTIGPKEIVGHYMGAQQNTKRGDHPR
jgi:SAM-dependent methyltransferase